MVSSGLTVSSDKPDDEDEDEGVFETQQGSDWPIGPPGNLRLVWVFSLKVHVC